MKFQKNEHSRNYVLDGDGFFISYNPNPGVAIFSKSLSGMEISFFTGDNNSDETALVKEDSDIKYRVLNGDFRAEYEKLVSQGFEVCLAFYNKMKSEHNSSWTSQTEGTE